MAWIDEMLDGAQQTYDKFDRFIYDSWSQLWGRDPVYYKDSNDFLTDLVDYDDGYHNERSLIPGYDDIYQYLDRQKMEEDYYRNTGQRYAYGSRGYTFGSLNSLVGSLSRDARKGIYNVGELSRYL